MSQPDLIFKNHGSLVLLYPMSDLGLDWVDENISEERMDYGGAIVCEPRYVNDIAEGAIIDGLVIA